MPKLSNYTRELTILSLSSITLAHIDRLWIYSYDDLYAYGNYAIAFVGASIIQLIIQPFYKTFFLSTRNYTIHLAIISIMCLLVQLFFVPVF